MLEQQWSKALDQQKIEETKKKQDAMQQLEAERERVLEAAKLRIEIEQREVRGVLKEGDVGLNRLLDDRKDQNQRETDPRSPDRVREDTDECQDQKWCQW